MHTEVAPRQSGKTTKMINWLKEKENQYAVMVVVNHHEEMRLHNLYNELKERIYCFDCYKSFSVGRFIEKICIDNADYVLQSLFRPPIVLISINEREEL